MKYYIEMFAPFTNIAHCASSPSTTIPTANMPTFNYYSYYYQHICYKLVYNISGS